MKKQLRKLFALCSLSSLIAIQAPLEIFAQENVITLSTNSEPPTIDPSLSTDTTSGSIIDNVFENLTEITPEQEIVPGAAESWEVSEDGLVYTFKIQKDAKWSNGDPVTAKDFEYAWKRMLNPETVSPRANLYYVIKGAEDYNTGKGKVEDVGVKALDDQTLEVTLHTPVAYFLELINHYAFAPVNQKVVESDETWASEAGENYVTNGPFVLSEWNHNSDYTLTKNDQYWDKDNVQLDQVNVKIIESEATASAEFQSGGIDFLGSPYGAISLESVDVFKDMPNFTKQAYSGIYMYKLNVTDKVMSNVNIRKALALAIDRKALTENITKQTHIPALGFVPGTVKGFEEDRGYFKDADFKAAKEYLAKGLKELGMKDPSELTINLSINTSEAHSTIAQFVQESWNQNLGINTSIDNTEWQVYLAKIEGLDYQVGRMGWSGDYNDAASFLDMYYAANTPNNSTGWENSEFQKLMDQAQTELDEAKRTQLLLDAEAIMAEDMPVIPVYYNETIYIHSDKIKSMKPDAIGRYNLKYIELNK